MKEHFESLAEWKKHGEEIFGTDDHMKWAWKCPSCNRKQSISEFTSLKDKGATPDSAATECIGRYYGGRKGKYDCDWAAYGFFSGPVIVKTDDKPMYAFQFWSDENEPETKSVEDGE